MTDGTTIFTAEFPGAVRGYSKSAVDAFVAQIGKRLEAMQLKLDEQSERLEQLTAASASSNEELAGYREKEAAIAGALVAMEQRRMAVAQELEQARVSAQEQAAEIVAQGHQEADRVTREADRRAEETVAQAETHAEEITRRAAAACEAEEERLRALRSEYEATVERIRRALEAQLALLPGAQAEVAAGMVLTTSVENRCEEASRAA